MTLAAADDAFSSSPPLVGKNQVWQRPAAPNILPETHSLCFQSIEAEQGSLHSRSATIQLFGITKEGYSVMLHVTGFKHYLYIPAPASFQYVDCAPFRIFLETKIGRHRPVIDDITLVLKQDIYGYQDTGKSYFLKITVREARDIAKVRSVLRRGEGDWKGLWQSHHSGIATYDKIPYILRFMVDCKIRGMSWVEAPIFNWELIPEHSRQSNCQIEAQVHYRDLISHEPDGDWAKMAPLRILSFDIQCAGRKDVFPEADQDQIIQIANVVTKYGDKNPFVQNIFCINTTGDAIGQGGETTEVFNFDSESQMLSEWQKFIITVDPDVIIGYDIYKFDFPYLLNRAEYLKVAGFEYWSRLPNETSRPREMRFSSKYMRRNGNIYSTATNIHGRLQLDLVQPIQRDYGLPSYTLNFVSAHFLGEQKEEITPSVVTELFNGTPETRNRLALYCLKHAYLPQRLMEKLSCFENLTEMARVTGIPFNWILSKGPHIRFVSQLFRKALEQDFVIPNQEDFSELDWDRDCDFIYQIGKYYEQPVVRLDFPQQLYASIIQAYNLCYTTLVPRRAQIQTLQLKANQDYITTPSGDMFVTPKRRKSLLAQMLEQFFTAHEQANRELAAAVETDQLNKVRLKARQLALMASARSVHHWTGETTAGFPCLEIARGAAAFSGNLVKKATFEIENKYTTANGYPGDAQVIYGNVDFIMIKFGTKDVAESIKLAQEAAQYISAKFIQPIELKFEKVYLPLLIFRRKRYAGLSWTHTQPNTPDQVDEKCIGGMQRHSCLLVQEVIEAVLRMIFIEKNVLGAQEYVKNIIHDLARNKVDISKLILTKRLSNDEYEPGGRHFDLAQRMKKRNPMLAPSSGDHLVYVVIHAQPGAEEPEKFEEPTYVLEHNLRINVKYYRDKQLGKPLMRIFEPIIGESRAQSFLMSDYTRAITLNSPSNGGGLGKFAISTSRCLGCKKPLVNKQETGRAVCSNCSPRIEELHNNTRAKVSDLEANLSHILAKCHRCQGREDYDFICGNKECSILSMRTKIKRDLEDATRQLGRFDAYQAIVW